MVRRTCRESGHFHARPRDKFTSLVLSIFGSVFLISALLVVVPPTTSEAVAATRSRNEETLEIQTNPETGTPAFVRVRGARVREGSPVDVAHQFLAAHRETFGVEAQRDLVPLRTQKDGPDRAHVRFNQKIDSVPVYGAQLVVHLRREKDGMAVESVSGRSYPTNTKVPTNPVTTPEWATRFAEGHLRKGEVEGSPQLVLLAHEGRLQLAWHAIIEPSDELARYEVFVGAIDPRVLLSFNSLSAAHGDSMGSGPGVNGATRSIHTYHHADSAFYLWDVSNPIYHPDLPFDPAMDPFDVLFQGVIATYSAGGSDDPSALPGILTSDSDNLWSDPAAVDAQFHAGLVEEFFRTKLGRPSIDDGLLVPGGMSMVSSVHFGTDPLIRCNAFWTGFQLVYGDGGDCAGGPGADFRPFSGALDVAAHEFTHGVTQFSAGLLNLHQSGAMNESFSDYLGNAAENNFTGRTHGLIAEDICIPTGSFCETFPDGKALRDLNNGKTMADYEFLTGHPLFGDSGGVHVNSDIYSDAIWNIREAFGSASGQAGRDFADRIIYRAHTVYLFPLAVFADGRDATLHAAHDLGATPTQMQTIIDEFDAHEIGWVFHNAYVPSGFGVALQSGFQHSPSVDGSGVAWIDGNDGLAHVLDTVTDTEVTLGNGLVVDLDISGDRLVWSELDIETFLFRVMTVTLPLGSPTLVSTADDEFDHLGARIDGSVVVWMVFDGTDFDTMWDDLSTTGVPPAALTTEVGTNELFPVVGHDGATTWAAWEDYRFGDPDIFTRSLPGGSESDRTPTIEPQIAPAIDGPNVVYLEDTDFDLVTFERLARVHVSSGDPVSIDTTPTDFFPPAIEGTTVAYSELMAETAYDLVTNNLDGTALTTVSNARLDQLFPDIGASGIVWEDTQLGDTDIFANFAAESISPTVNSVEPVDGATGVPVSSAVSAIFSEDMDARSLNNGTFTLQELSGPDILGSVEYGFDSRAATYVPFVPLSEDTTYDAKLAAPARDTRGNILAAPFEWSFSTGGFSFVIPEGTTKEGMTTFVLLANPSSTTAVHANLTFLTEVGPVEPTSLQNLTVAPGQRRTVNVNTELSGAHQVATLVEADGLLVAEVSVHKAGSLASYEVTAAEDPSTSWIVPEGATHSGFDTFISIANPNPLGAVVDVSFLRPGGVTTNGPQNLSVPALSRLTVKADDFVPADDVSTRVTAESGSVVVGMSIHKQQGSDIGIGGSLGLTSTAPTWVVPEGATGFGFATFVLVANPTDEPATVNVRFLRKAGGPLDHEDLQGKVIPPRSRETISVDTYVPDDDVSTLVTAVSGEVAVESTIQKDDSTGFVIGDSVGSPGASVTDAAGTKWLAAEGATHSRFTAFILIANPTGIPANVSLTYLRPAGQQPGPSLVIPAGTRRTVSVNSPVSDGGCGCEDDISTLVMASSGAVVVELAMDRVLPGVGFSKQRSLSARLPE